MIPTRQQVDTWQATVHATLAEVQAEVEDLIDVDRPETVLFVREPSRREREVTDTADGRFAPTPHAPARRSTPADPTLEEVARWESRVERALTRLYAVVALGEEITRSLGLTVTTGEGHLVAAPIEPATRSTGSGVVVVSSPQACRLHARLATCWLGYLVDSLAARLHEVDDPDVGDHLLDLTHQLRERLTALVPRPDPIRLCACGCRRPLGNARRPIRDACQKRREREARP